MFLFENLHILDQHKSYLNDIIPHQEIFVVWGCIRDILLWITNDPLDIDITCAWNPDEIWELMNFDETLVSRFRTEKYGTMTFLPKDSPIEYELTPFRTEAWYSDNRHPDKITWSNDLLLDSARRDFRINCLYRTSVDKESISTSESNNLWSIDLIHLYLKDKKTIFLQDSSTIIITNQEDIKEICKEWFINIDTLSNLISNAIIIWDQGDHNVISILIDPHAWLEDLISNKIQTVWVPDDRFKEDALRIIRGVRFVNTLNQSSANQMDFEKWTWISMQQNSPLIDKISSERLHDELVKVFQKDNPFWYIALIQELQLLPTLFPALDETRHNDQPVRYHSFDTYTHTLLCLHELQKILLNRVNKGQDDYLVKFAMLYHDVGKPEQYEQMWKAIEENPENPDRSSYEYHTESWAKLAIRDFKALSFSKKEIEIIAWYIRRHHRPWEILDGKKEKRAVRLRKLMSDWGYEATINLLDISIADRRWQYNPIQSPAVQEIEELKILLTQLYEDEWRFTLKDLAVSWNDIIEYLSLSAWPGIWEHLEKAFNRVISDISGRNQKDKILWYIKSL